MKMNKDKRMEEVYEVKCWEEATTEECVFRDLPFGYSRATAYAFNKTRITDWPSWCPWVFAVLCIVSACYRVQCLRIVEPARCDKSSSWNGGFTHSGSRDVRSRPGSKKKHESKGARWRDFKWWLSLEECQGLGQHRTFNSERVGCDGERQSDKDGKNERWNGQQWNQSGERRETRKKDRKTANMSCKMKRSMRGKKGKGGWQSRERKRGRQGEAVNSLPWLR